LTCNEDVSVAPVRVAGVNVPVIPVGGLTRLSATSVVKFVRAIVIVEVAFAPAAIGSVVGDAVIVNVPAATATATVVTVAPAATVPGGAPPPAGLPITGTQLLVPLGTGLVLLLLGLAFVARSARTRRKV